MQLVRNLFVRTRKEFCVIVAVNGITLLCKCINMDHRLYRELSSSDDLWYYSAPLCGLVNLPAGFLRTCAKELSIPLGHLFNLSLRTGKMPTLWNINPILTQFIREIVGSSLPTTDLSRYC